MPTSCQLWQDGGYVEATFAGEVGPDELETAILRTLEVMQSSRIFRVLADVRGLRGGHSVVDLFGMVVYLEKVALPPSFREALLVPGGTDLAMPEVRFWEDACRNRGISVRMFDDRDGALAWLGESPC